jgi:hypothetical protein
MDLAKSAVRGEPAQSVEALCRYKTCTCLASARAAIAAHEAALAEAGYVIVLKEPTEAAIRAGQAKLDSKLTGGAWNIEADDVWRAMIDAATEPVPDNPARDL